MPPAPCNSFMTEKKHGGNKKLPVYHTDYLANELERLGWDPIAEYIRCIAEVTEPKDKAELIEKIWKYCFPTKRSVEVSGNVTQTLVELSPQQLAGILQADAFKQSIEVKSEPKEEKPSQPPTGSQDPFAD